MWQVREAFLRPQKVRSDTKRAEQEPVPRRWGELVLYLEEKEREGRQGARKSEAH